MPQAIGSRANGPGIGVLGAAAIGVGGMVGGGIFAVLGTAVGLAGGGTPIAFLLAGIVALLTAYSYVKLSVRFPSAGGTTAFINRAFGIDLMTGTLNLLLWLSYLVTIALYASAFGAYAITFFENQSEGLRHTLVTLAIVVPAVLNLLDASIVSKSETAIVTFKIVLLGVVIVAGFPHVELNRLSPSTWAAPGSLVAGGMVIFVAYEGFELISNTAEDVRRPAYTLPRAIYGCVGFVIVLYILVSVVTVGSVSAEAIVSAQDYALAEAARPSLGQTGFVLVAISAVLATLSAINATIYGSARLGFVLAADGELPRIVGRRAWSRPVAGIAVTAGLSILLANLVDMRAIAVLASAGFLVIFTAVNIAAVKLSQETGARRLIPAIAALCCFGAFVALIAYTVHDSPGALWLFGAFVVGSFVFEYLFGVWRRGGYRLPQ